VHRPQTILLDEPTSGLDVNAVRTLRDLLRDLRAAGRCILFSSHVMQDVAALCDDIVILSGGRVVVSGAPREILAYSGADDLEEAFVRLAHAEHEG
jgi:sodium transport system ATP-binding protein